MRQVRTIMLLGLLPFAAVVIARWNQPPSATDGDYAHYLLHAKALAESRPYTDIGYIYTDMNLVGPRAQPPGWPIVLAPFVALFGTHSPVFKLLQVILVAAFGVISGFYFVRRGETLAGLAAAAVVPLALETDFATSSALSDPLFCLLVWLTLYIADDPRPMRWGRAAAQTFLAAAALAVRVAGVALLPALVLHAVIQERRGQTRIKLLVPLLIVVAAAGLVVWKLFHWVPFLDRSLTELSPQRLVAIAQSYRATLFTGTLYPFGWNHANDVYHVAVVVPIVIGAVHFFRTQYRSALACFIVMYVCTLIFAPVRDPRYAWPLAPLLVVWLVNGLLWLVGRVRPAMPAPRTARVLATAVALLVVAAAWRLMRLPPRRSLIGDPDTIALFDWARTTGDTADVRVVFTNPRVLTLETEVPAMGIPFGSRDAVIAELERKRITHVVVSLQPRRPVEDSLRTLVSARSSRFTSVFRNGSYDVEKFLARTPPADSGSATTTRSP